VFISCDFLILAAKLLPGQSAVPCQKAKQAIFEGKQEQCLPMVGSFSLFYPFSLYVQGSPWRGRVGHRPIYLLLRPAHACREKREK